MKRLYFLLGSIIASISSIYAQIAQFIELGDADNPFSSISDELDVHIADLDDDGFEEVIFHSSDLSTIRYFQNDGTGTFTELSTSDNPLTAIQDIAILENGDNKRFEFADFDNDGDTDAAVFSQKYYNDGSVLLFANDGNQNYDLINSNLQLPGGLSNGAFTDVDEDGDIDCISSNFIYDENNKIWNAYAQVSYFDDVTGSFGAFEDFTSIEGEELVFIDIDEDGDEDAFAGQQGAIMWQEKTGASAYAMSSSSPVNEMQMAASVFQMDVGDFNGDGELDMVFFDPMLMKMRYYEQNCAGPPGTACDDGDACTINDALDANCNCVGDQAPDTDMDGICDPLDETNGDCALGGVCDDGDPCTENDVFDADCNCAGTPGPDSDMDGICDAIDETNGDCTLGETCDDGDVCTINDAFDANCNCIGEAAPDADMDGICDTIDETNGDCTLGGSCDDGDPCTLNDAFDADCNCVGDQAPDTDMDGICDPIDETNGDCTLGAPCDDGDVCTINDFFDENCNCAGTFQDGDMDGICDALDDCDGTLTGLACDDGDDCTVNDIYDDNCLCAGTFVDTDMDGICDADDNTNGDCELGAACDDGDECTVNDVFDADCNCAGTPSGDSDMDGICDAIDETNGDCQLGAACDDGDACTIDDAFDVNCNCVGVFQDSDMDGICDAEDDTNGDCELGATCDDGDVCTENDAFDADCNCVGTPLPDSDMDGLCDDIDNTNGDCELGAACDDGDACTIDDAFDADCQCIGLFQDEDEDTVCDAEDQCPGLDDLLLPVVGDADMDGDVDCDDLLVSVDEITAEQFIVFPNPTNGLIRIDSPYLLNGVDVYSAQGKHIRSLMPEDNVVDLVGMSAGLYIIEIKIEDGLVRKKIILE